MSEPNSYKPSDKYLLLHDSKSTKIKKRGRDQIVKNEKAYFTLTLLLYLNSSDAYLMPQLLN